MRIMVSALALAAFCGATPVVAAEKLESPSQNVRSSDMYQRDIQSNKSFRTRRMQEECGPISDAALKQQCMDSFHTADSGASSETGAPAKHHRRHKAAPSDAAPPADAGNAPT